MFAWMQQMALISKRIHARVLERKRRLDNLRPLPSALVGRLREQMQVEYTYNSNAIEGNTLTLQETRLVIEEGFTVSGKSLRETLEAKNHPEAIEFVANLATSKKEINEEAVLHIHELIMLGITEDAGRYRTVGVRITGASFMPPPSSEVRPRMNELLKWLKDNPDEHSPIELAAVFHHRFVQIHPFVEGNGRTARLLMNAVLIGNGYPFIAIVPKRDRQKYLKALMDADLGNLSAFVNFVAMCVEGTLGMYLNSVEEPEILTLAEASKITQYSQEYLSLLARQGLLGSYKQGRNWVVTKGDLDKYLQSVNKSKNDPKMIV